MARKDKLLLGAVLALACVLTVVCVCTGHPITESGATAVTGTAEEMALAAENALMNGTCRRIELADGGSKALCPDVGIDGNQVTVTGPGIYHITGDLGKGRLTVRADGNVILVLDGVTVRGEDGPALTVEDAKHTLLYLAEGSGNTLTSAAATVETADGAEEASGAAVYARDPLYVAGRGSLTVDGAIHNGISTTDDLVILDGTLQVTAVHTGLRGKDSLTVLGGEVTVYAGNTADLMTDLPQTEQMPDLGQRPADLPEPPAMGGMPGDPGEMKDPPETVPGDSGEMKDPPETMPGDSGDMKKPPDTRPGNMPDTMPQDRPEPPNGGGSWGSWGGFGGNPWESSSATKDTSDGKGLMTEGQLEIRGGTVTVVSADDALHAGVCVTVSGGSLTLTAGDDGIHSDERVTVTGGDIRVSRSNEGIEGHEIDIAGGSLSVVASDDGMNANGGPDLFAWNWPQTEEAEETTPASLTVRGGEVYVSAGGDGLDSNGDLILLGGRVIVDGPSNGANGALDSGSENGGEARVEGGTLLAIGSSGMAETFGDTSTQCSFIEKLSKVYPAGTAVTVRAADGTVLVEHTSAGSFDSVVFTDPALKVGESCTLTVGDDALTVSLDAVTNGEGSGFAMPSFGGFGWR